MFKIRADFSETFEVNANLEKVREFFTDVRNFVELMPGIESIHTDSNGVIHWKICANIPFVGSFTEKFAVVESENSDERVEWSPFERDGYNLMRYAADFFPKSKESTLVQYSQNVELRRNSAADLHFLAGFAGERTISSEMTRRISEMLKKFIEKSRLRMES
ncbi:MAG: SRPBCC domain-containing protein [Pyrinomonadaceae bacterium]